MSSEKLNLSSEFEKICIDPQRKKTCECSSSTEKPRTSSDPNLTPPCFKVSSRRKNLIKPSRLKFIYKTQGDAIKEGTLASSEEDKTDELEDYSSEAFQLLRDLRITPSEMAESQSSQQSMSDEKDDRMHPTSCSAQYTNKLQQQISPTSEFDSTIDAMSDYLSYHLKLHKDRNFSNIMYL